MKYLVPLLCFAAPLCPQAGLSTTAFVSYFIAGLFTAVWAYEKADVPYVSFYTEGCDG